MLVVFQEKRGLILLSICNTLIVSNNFALIFTKVHSKKTIINNLVKFDPAIYLQLHFCVAQMSISINMNDDNFLLEDYILMSIKNDAS